MTPSRAVRPGDVREPNLPAFAPAHARTSRRLVVDDDTADAPTPRVLDSFILDTEYELVSDHAPIGCHVLL